MRATSLKVYNSIPNPFSLHQMGSIFFPSSARYPATASSSIPIPPISHSSNLLRTSLIHKRDSPKICCKTFIANPSDPLKRKGLTRAALDRQSSGSGEQDGNRAVEAVLKLYSAMKNQNVGELKDIIHDECRCICNFVSFSQPLYGKEQVLDFLVSLIRFLGNHLEFRVEHTQREGMTVGVHWRLAWNKAHFPLGKGFSFHICQIYRGKMVIRNVEMFMEPLLHIEPLRLKIIKYVTIIMDKVSCSPMLKPRTRRILAATGVTLLLIAMIFCIKIG